jgi:hypothetical protein
MKKKTGLGILALAMLSGSALFAQDITGDWQGTLKAGAQELRVVVVIDKSAEGNWNSTFGAIDQTPDWGARTAIDTITLQGSNLKFAIAGLREAMLESSVQMARPSKVPGHKAGR